MVSINGKSYTGNVISISNGKVFIDGKLATEDNTNNKIININIKLSEGTNIEIDHASTIQLYGNLNELKSGSGNVEVMGDVKSIKTGSGNVKFETLSAGGTVNTGSGNIKYKKAL